MYGPNCLRAHRWCTVNAVINLQFLLDFLSKDVEQAGLSVVPMWRVLIANVHRTPNFVQFKLRGNGVTVKVGNIFNLITVGKAATFRSVKFRAHGIIKAVILN
jgi:hypothetical protein